MTVATRLAILKEKLSDATPLLRIIGKIVVDDCTNAFIEQRLGDIPWPERYPKQGPPPINVAGALQDFIDGATRPKENRFAKRPALVDLGDMSQSIRMQLEGTSAVRVFSIDPKAYTHHHGLTTTQTYGREVQRRIADWLDDAPEYRTHMNRLLHKGVHKTQVNMRPIIGLTDAAQEKIAQEVRAYFGGRD